MQFLPLAQGGPDSGAWRECPWEGGSVTMASLSDLRPDDRVLISRALCGDQEALNDLFSRYYRFLHFLACRVLGGREDAQDVVQNCLLRAVRNLQQFNNNGAFRSWLARILVNEAISLLRKRRSSRRFSVARVSSEDEREVFDRLPGPGLNPEQALAKKESILALTREVARLSAPLRSVVILCGFHEYSMEEAGAVLCVTKEMVRGRLFRARKQLEAAMRSTQCSVC
jgi:RNA polymerase sigma-70 factor, ECF subfamily